MQPTKFLRCSDPPPLLGDHSRAHSSLGLIINHHKAQSAAAHRPVEVGQGAFDRVVYALGAERRLAEAFAGARWPVLDDFMVCEGPALMLDLIQASPGERWV